MFWHLGMLTEGYQQKRAVQQPIHQFLEVECCPLGSGRAAGYDVGHQEPGRKLVVIVEGGFSIRPNFSEELSRLEAWSVA